MPHLSSPYTLRALRLRNRTVLSLMGMYSAGQAGLVTDWHLAHDVDRATGGVGLLIAEPELTGKIVRNGRAAPVTLERELLCHPNWPLVTTWILGHDIAWSQQYRRARHN